MVRMRALPEPPGARSRASRRAEILRRAAGVFRAKGFHRAGMRDIASALGLAPGALYYYFESKEDLLHACQDLALERLLASAREIAERRAPPEEKLRRLVAAHLEHVLGELGGSLAHVEFHALPEPRLAEVVAKRDAYERLVRRILREGVRRGAFRRMDVKLAAMSLLGALNWAAVWWRPDGGYGPAEIAHTVSDTFARGFRK